MKTEIFNKILENRIKKINDVLNKKGKEYAKRDDRLHHFRLSANIDNITMEADCWDKAKKHLVSIMDMKNDPDTITESLIDAKIGDMINYLILMEAIMRERLIKRLDSLIKKAFSE